MTMTVDGPELKGTASDDTSLYGLVMAGQWPLRANASVVKVVWRMTGVGELRISIEDPSGATRELAWGPELHGGSSYTTVLGKSGEPDSSSMSQAAGISTSLAQDTDPPRHGSTSCREFWPTIHRLPPFECNDH